MNKYTTLICVGLVALGGKTAEAGRYVPVTAQDDDHDRTELSGQPFDGAGCFTDYREEGRWNQLANRYEAYA